MTTTGDGAKKIAGGVHNPSFVGNTIYYGSSDGGIDKSMKLDGTGGSSIN